MTDNTPHEFEPQPIGEIFDELADNGDIPTLPGFPEATSEETLAGTDSDEPIRPAAFAIGGVVFTEQELEADTLLDVDQQARAEALFQAKELLTSEAKSVHPFGGRDDVATHVKRSEYAGSLITLATYILDGPDFLEDKAERTPNDIAAEFTGGEADLDKLRAKLTGDVPHEFEPYAPEVSISRLSDGRVVLAYDGTEYFSKSYVRDHPDDIYLLGENVEEY